jgi:two-component system, NarL family, response regulator NreC
MGKTLLIIEPSEVIRQGLIQVIGSFDMFENIKELTCNADIEASVVKHDPDIMVINPTMIKPGLPEWFKEYGNGQMKIAAIVYALFDDELIEVFDEIIQIGDTRLKIRSKLNSLINNIKVTQRPVPDNTLSAREKDVIKLLAKGLSNKEISEQLFISTHTAITHRRNITRKLNIRSVAGLIVYAIINEIVTVEELS